MANSAALYRAILDGLCYRGTAFIQSFTTCQPEHGVPDEAAQLQAQRIRDSRGMPEFVYNPQLGETYEESLDVKGNPQETKDWYENRVPVTKKKYTYTVAHWAFTEARFRLHHKIVKPEAIQELIRLEDKMLLMTMDDVVNRRYLDPDHRSFIPDRGVYATAYTNGGEPEHHVLSRQMVLFCVERRKAWRLLQSRAGVINPDYKAQKDLLKQIDSGELSVEDFQASRQEDADAANGKGSAQKEAAAGADGGGS